MDIRDWVQGVVAGEESDAPARLGLSRFLQPRQQRDPEAGENVRKRKRSSGGGSFLEKPASPAPPRSSAGVKPPRPSPILVPGLARMSDSHSIDKSSDRYRRKPRHRTRVERYDHIERHGKQDKSKQDKIKQSAKQSGKVKRKEYSSQKKPDAARIRDFRAKNVANDRLTIQHGHRIGVFTNIKTSASRRDFELPDLAFSRLQNTRDQEGDTQSQNTDGPKPTKKREKAILTEAESSANFALNQHIAPGHEQNSGIRVPLFQEKSLTRSLRSSKRVNRSTNIPSTRPTRNLSDAAPTVSSGPIYRSAASYPSWPKSRAPLSSKAMRPSSHEVTKGGEHNYETEPFRSLSLGILNIRNQIPRRRTSSNRVNRSTNLSIGSRNSSLERLSLSGVEAQYTNRKSLVFGPGHNSNKILSTSKLRPHRHTDRNSPQDRAWEGLSSYDGDQDATGRGRPENAKQDEGLRELSGWAWELSSMTRLLENCSQARAEAAINIPTEAESQRERHKDCFVDSKTPGHHYGSNDAGMDRERNGWLDPEGSFSATDGNFEPSGIYSLDPVPDEQYAPAEDAYDETENRFADTDAYSPPYMNGYQHGGLKDNDTQPVVNLPCVGGLEPYMLRLTKPKVDEDRPMGGFWRPNKLY